MNCKRIVCTLTFLDRPKPTYLPTIILEAILGNTKTSI